MSTPPSSKTSRRTELEAWWAFAARILGFLFGMYLLYREQGPPPGVEWAIVAAAVGCMGPVVASSVASVLEAARGTPKP
ncbi:MAG: hypothetical protein AVDCRST_MAG68-2133 [uncultured Gemmatimonadetes bacterium]|uniref:Uncharacterized protein n=1 Tax=uncultured Gemmatimonadota bacterium TaxID=203437 RepID=A0A6J4L726_9BACT|nr:MAG: hypothetical protein AVDCRST_MAG68-2133 [uncultured Gemmatimonadota bacterium]